MVTTFSTLRINNMIKHRELLAILFLFLDPGTLAFDAKNGFEERLGNCYNVHGSKKGTNFRIKDTCSIKKNPQIVDLCENSPRTLYSEWKDSQNMASLIPYTDLSGNITYRNIYCAMCNEDFIPNLNDDHFHTKFDYSLPSMWDLRVQTAEEK